MNKEKHFMVTKLIVNDEKMGDEETQVIEAVELEAVMTGRMQRMDWHALQDRERWKQGWMP